MVSLLLLDWNRIDRALDPHFFEGAGAISSHRNFLKKTEFFNKQKENTFFWHTR